jgi:hypothetical protein
MRHRLVEISIALMVYSLHHVAFYPREHFAQVANLFLLFLLRRHIDFSSVLVLTHFMILFVLSRHVLYKYLILLAPH